MVDDEPEASTLVSFVFEVVVLLFEGEEEDWLAICQAGIPARLPVPLIVAAKREDKPSVGDEVTGAGVLIVVVVVVVPVGVEGALDTCSTAGRRLTKRDLSDFISFWSSVKAAFCDSLLRSKVYNSAN